LFLCNRQKTSFYLLLMPGDKPFHTKEITSQLGCARLSFAREEALEQLLHLTPGSATIFGLMYDTENQVQLVVDQELLREPYFGCHPCINTSTVRMQTSDVFDKLTNALHHTYVTVTLKGE
ncbi:YbaK/EbsC family protein, partial [uncultured Ruminococcus sp.]